MRLALADEDLLVREAASDALLAVEHEQSATVNEVVDRLLRQNRREWFRPYEVDSVMFSGWITRLPSGKHVDRDMVKGQTQPIIAFGKAAVLPLLKWVKAEQWHVRYIAIHALQEITGLKPGGASSQDFTERERAIRVWRAWCDEQRPVSRRE